MKKKIAMSLMIVGMLCASTLAGEVKQLSLLGDDEQSVNVSPDNYLIALAPLQAPFQSPKQAPLQAPLKAPIQKQVQAPSKLSLSDGKHSCFVLFPARRAALQELRDDRRLNRGALVGSRRVNDGGDVTVGESTGQCTSGQCNTSTVSRVVGSRTVQENPGNQCGSNGQCSGGRRGLFRR